MQSRVHILYSQFFKCHVRVHLRPITHIIPGKVAVLVGIWRADLESPTGKDVLFCHSVPLMPSVGDPTGKEAAAVALNFAEWKLQEGQNFATGGMVCRPKDDEAK